MNKSRDECYDNLGRIHRLGKKISEGGQGIVYRTRDADVAVKLVTIKPGIEVTAEKSIMDYHERFLRVRLLPVPKETNITFPKTLLKGRAGYVMDFLSDMVPVGFLWINENNAEEIKDEEIPAWLKEVKDDDIKAAKYYVAYQKTGGLRRRLLILHKVASQLALLHGAGLVYCDINANNIFISGEEDRGNVWIIDADNLKFEGEGGWVCTMYFGAPELVQEISTNTMASDCHSFAALAYIILSMAEHPFLGKKVSGGDWADTDVNEDPRIRAFEGRYPWIHDEDDDSNSCDDWFAPQMLYGDEIANLFQKTFGKGRLDPSRRPSIFHWPLAFVRAADSTIQCPSCKMSYPYDCREDDGKEQCPYCDAPRPVTLVMEAYSWDGALGEKQWLFVHEAEAGTALRIPARVFSLAPLTQSDITVLEIEIKEKMLYFRKADDAEIDFSVAVTGIEQGQFKKLTSQIRFQMEQKNMPPEKTRIFIFAESDNCSRMVQCRIEQGQK